MRGGVGRCLTAIVLPADVSRGAGTDRSIAATRRRRLVAVLALTTAGVLAACGGSDDAEAGGETTETAGAPAGADPADPTGPTDPADAPACASDTEVSDAVGTDVALDPSSGGDVGCNYYSEDGTVSVNVLVEDPTARTVEDVERNDAGFERVEGAGDAAYAAVTPGGIVQFGVFEGTSHRLVTIDGADADVATGQAVYQLFA